MKKSTFLGMLVVVVGFAGCGTDEPCAPAGTWSVTGTPLPEDDCSGGQAETSPRVITVMNGTATITDPSDGSSNSAGLDASCHMSYVTAVSTPDYVAAGSGDWTFNGASLSGTISGHATLTADGSMCTLKIKLVGVRQ